MGIRAPFKLRQKPSQSLDIPAGPKQLFSSNCKPSVFLILQLVCLPTRYLSIHVFYLSSIAPSISYLSVSVLIFPSLYLYLSSLCFCFRFFFFLCTAFVVLFCLPQTTISLPTRYLSLSISSISYLSSPLSLFQFLIALFVSKFFFFVLPFVFQSFYKGFFARWLGFLLVVVVSLHFLARWLLWLLWFFWFLICLESFLLVWFRGWPFGV